MSMPKKTISTVDELIDTLGGPTAIARWLGIKQSAVSNWRLPTRPGIPAGWHLRLYREAKARGFEIADEVFETDAVGRPNIEPPKKKANGGVAHRAA
jgi:hypothetical protein